MLSKQLTSRLKEEQEKDQHQLNVAQCDRLIRTVSCKDDEKHGMSIQSPSKIHEANHAIKKVNINVLQLFDDIRLYVPPSYVVLSKNGKSGEQSPPSVVVSGQDQKESQLSSPSKSSETATVQPATSSTGEVLEVNFKDVLAQIIESLSPSSVNCWFSLNPTTSPSADDSQSSGFMSTSLFDSISQALQLIDFNLKRNSDFINELTKLLDTSRAIKQEAHLKKLLKTLEDEKLTNSTLPVPQLASMSQPSSPIIKPANSENEVAQRAKSKSFKGFGGKSKSKENNSSAASTVTTPTNPSAQFLAPPQSQLLGGQSSPNGSTPNLLATLIGSKAEQLSSPNDNEMINNSDYIELELEVEQIAFTLDKLNKQWTRLAHSRQALSNGDVSSLKYALELQNMLNELNSLSILNDLDKSLFKLNWLVTSKSGFSEPNWKTNVLSLTPSTIDSFIGVNLLKNYYKYVKYDFVSYKLFTRQLQLIQLSAVLLSLVHRILNFYKETITLSSINGASFLVNSSAATSGNSLSANSGATQPGANTVNQDTLNQSLLSFSFSADKYKPISWSANHVTLYNVQSGASKASQEDKLAANRASPIRRDTSQSRSAQTRDEQIRQIKNELFLRDVNEFLKLSTQRLNIQSSLANRTGYFYIVNKSTGLVLQAVDFASDYSLKDQIENNQKRLQSVKGAKGGSAQAQSPATSAGSPVTKGPRFYLMPKANTNQQNVMNQKSGVNQQQVNTSSLLHDSSSASNDEQLWYYYLINGCVANKIIRSGYCMAASSLNPKSPVTFWPNVKTTNCSWFFNHQDSTIVSGLSEDLVLDYSIIDDGPKQRYSVIIDQKVANKASQKWSFEFC